MQNSDGLRRYLLITSTSEEIPELSAMPKGGCGNGEAHWQKAATCEEGLRLLNGSGVFDGIFVDIADTDFPYGIHWQGFLRAIGSTPLCGVFCSDSGGMALRFNGNGAARFPCAPLDSHPDQLQKFSSVVEQSAEAVLITNRDGIIEYVNPAFEEVSGYKKDELTGQTPRVLRSGTYPPEHYAMLWKTILAGGVYRAEIINRRKDGSLYHEEKIITPIRNAAGEITHFVSTGRDITERIRTEQERRRLREELQKKERLAVIGQTVAGISHCMKNIFASLYGGIHLIDNALKTKNWEIGIQGHDMLHRSYTRLYLLMMELLDFSKQRTPSNQSVPLRPMFEEAARLLRPVIHLGKVVIELDVAPDAEFCRVDDNRLLRTLLNLGINAIDAMPRGGILSLRARAVKSEEFRVPEPAGVHRVFPEGKTVVIIEVADTGIGIPEESRHQLFEPFFSTKGSKGTGLGLPAVKQFVEEHEGALWVESHPERGTTFFMAFRV